MSRASVLARVALGAAGAALPAVLFQALAPPAFAQEASADRYGPPSAGSSDVGPTMRQGVASAPRLPQSRPIVMLRMRTLSWPGKQDQVAAPAYAPAPFVSPTTVRPSRGYRPAPYATAAAPSRGYAGSPDGGAAPYARRAYPGSVEAPRPYDRPEVQPLAAHVAYGGLGMGAAYPLPARASFPSPDAPSSDGWRPVFAYAPSRAVAQTRPSEPAPALAGVPSQPDLPTSIYTPAPAAQMTPAERAAAAPPPLRTASAAQRYGYDPAQGHQVRFYSVHRPFGLQPDSAPIPPQFFTTTADLSQPPGPLPTDRSTTTTTASGSRVSHVAPDTSVN